MKFTGASEIILKWAKMLVLPSLCISLQLVTSCVSRQGNLRTPPEQSAPPLSRQAAKPSEAATALPAPSQNNPASSQIDNQISVVELRERLEQVKAIEREARGLVVLRQEQNWMADAPECMSIMQRLKPRAAAIRDESQRMLSPAGIYISGAAMNLVGCINCVRNDDDDCSYARDFINKAERELKKEERQK